MIFAYVMIYVRYINILIIGACSGSPHTYDEYAAAVCMCIYIYSFIYIYVPYVMPYSSIFSFTMAVASEPL